MKANNATNSSHPTIAILQLTRFGDLIQTVQAIKSFRISHPAYRMVLIARSRFAKPLNFLLNKYFDAIYTIDTQSIFQDNQIDAKLLSLVQKTKS